MWQSDDTPRVTIPRIQKVNDKASPQYSVFVCYYNSDLVDKEKPLTPLGLVIPCGSYSKEEAEKVRDKISVETRATYTVICKNNQAYPFRPCQDGNSITYEYNKGDDVDKIYQSLQREKKRALEVRERTNKEIEERGDDDTISYLINKIYNVSNAERLQKEILIRLEEYKKVSERNQELVTDYFERHPEAINKWDDEARSRLTERAELPVYEMIKSCFSTIFPSHLQQM